MSLSKALDGAGLQEALAGRPDWSTVTQFIPSHSIRRLELRVDVDRLRLDAEAVMEAAADIGDGFGVFNVTLRPGTDQPTQKDMIGRYWACDDDYVEHAHDVLVDESQYTEIHSACAGTYIETVVEMLRTVAPIGRTRLLSKGPYNANSWHRDPEPRLHIPIVTNPGSLFVVNHHVTHLPADGSVYFTDTRSYHTAINGGFSPRLSLVAAVAIDPVDEHQHPGPR